MATQFPKICIAPLLAIVLVTLAGASIYAFRYFEFIGHHDRDPLAGEVRARVRNYQAALEVYSAVHGHFPRLLQSDEDTVNATLSRLLDLELSPSDMSDRGEVLDPWGSPYCMAYGEHNVSRITGRRGKQLLMWSRGPNRTNEWGKGDDVGVEWN